MDKAGLRALRRWDVAVFVLCIGLYVAVHVFRDRVSQPQLAYLLRCHANDFLGGAAFLAYMNLVLSWYRTGPRRVRRYRTVFAVACLCSLCWEGIAPLIKTSTADWWDCLAYLLGATAYWLADRRVVRRLLRTSAQEKT